MSFSINFECGIDRLGLHEDHRTTKIHPRRSEANFNQKSRQKRIKSKRIILYNNATDLVD